MSDDRGDVYKETARLTYDSLLEMRRLSFAAQADYGKWLISSIFLMHGAAIGGLAFKGATGAPTYLAAVGWFVAGLVLALASGFSTWVNFHFGAKQYDLWAKPSMISDHTQWPTIATHGRAIRVTMWLAIIFGFCSVACLVAGSVHVLRVWK
jgi:hypothetical protein